VSGTFDCTRCGACCCNSEENRAEGYTAYVEVGRRDALNEHPELLERWTTPDAHGVPHLKLDRDGRCLALKGRLGRRVRCEIYPLRPHGCRRVSEGSEACLRARRERGIDVEAGRVELRR